MMRLLFLVVPLLLAARIAAAQSPPSPAPDSARSPGAPPAAERDTGWTRGPRWVYGTLPELRVPPPRRGEREQVDFRVEVLIDADGRPDLETLRITGRGSFENKERVREWLRLAAFLAARKNGVPVAAPIRLRIIEKQGRTYLGEVGR